MKKLFNAAAALSVLFLLTGCLALQVGGGKKDTTPPTIGQQLIDLQTAKATGAITETEFQAQKAKILGR